METLLYSRIHFRCIHYFEILRFEVYSLSRDFSIWLLHHIRTIFRERVTSQPSIYVIRHIPTLKAEYSTERELEEKGSFTINVRRTFGFWDFCPLPSSNENVRSKTLPKWKCPSAFENLKTPLASTRKNVRSNINYEWSLREQLRFNAVRDEVWPK